jgi:hypothetical protein
MDTVFKNLCMFNFLIALANIRAFDQFIMDPARSLEFRLVGAVISQNAAEIERLILAGAETFEQPREGGSSVEMLMKKRPFRSMKSVVEKAKDKRQARGEVAESKEN